MSLTGASSLPVDLNPHAFASAHSFHSRTVTGNLPMAKGLIATWRIGFSVRSSLLPIAKLPPGSETISGSRTDGSKDVDCCTGVAAAVTGAGIGAGCGGSTGTGCGAGAETGSGNDRIGAGRGAIGAAC